MFHRPLAEDTGLDQPYQQTNLRLAPLHSRRSLDAAELARMVRPPSN